MISPETIALVRDRTDIVALVSESVPSLKRRGRSWVGLCPFHNEKTGSFHVNPDKGFFHCFGCKESGSAIDFVMKQEMSTFPEAVRSLAERAGVPVEEEERAPSEVLRAKKQKDDLYAVTQLAAVFFERQLREHPQRQFAHEELDRRGLAPSSGATASEPSDRQGVRGVDDAIQAFRIGYAPPGWDGLSTFLRQQGVSPIAAETVGLLVPRSTGVGHYDRFRHRLMFAVIDPQGRVIAFSGRALAPLPSEQPGKDGQEEQKPAKYINSPESPIYSKGHALFGLYQARHAIRQAGSATVVEGNFDVVSLHARGIDNVVAPLGTAFTVDQAKLLRRFTSQAVLLFDGDAAGKKAVRLSREPCKAAGLDVKVATLPTGKDPDEWVRERGVAALAEVVDGALGMLEFLVDGALDDSFAAADAQERIARVQYVKKLLVEGDDPLVRSMAKTYADRLAGRLDMIDSHGALERLLVKALAEVSRGPDGPSSRTARITPREAGAAERAEMVGALIEHPELLDDADVGACLSLLEGPSARTVAALASSLHRAPGGRPPATTRDVQSNETRDETRATADPALDPALDQAPYWGRPLQSAGQRPPPDRTSQAQKTLDTSSFLAQIPPPIQAFASERLAAPRHENREDAKGHLLENARKLRTVILGRETSDLARETYRALGDWQAETDLAREAAERVKQKLGLGRGQG